MEINSKAALFSEAGKPLELIDHKLSGRVDSGSVVCKVIMSTICGSDIHTISGRRTEPAPLILGHEIIGEIVELGEGIQRDGFDGTLETGDRISWSVMASCGSCFFCKHDLPQKCERIRKYGHTCFNDSPHLTGGYSEYICLYPGTEIYKIPEGISDEIATPANCALSTVINGIESIGMHENETVLIQGAGLLGLNLVALAVEAGAKKIIVTDINQSRLDMARRFGADLCINLQDVSQHELTSVIRNHTSGYGVDVAHEVCGVGEAVSQAIELLRIGGRYLIAGLVTPGNEVPIDGNKLTRKNLTIKGIHNYHPRHLGVALRFLEKHSHKYPYDKLVEKVFPLSQINEAIELASTGEYIRIGIRI